MIHFDTSYKQWLLFFLYNVSGGFIFLHCLTVFFFSAGPLHCDRCLLAFLLLGILLLGADGGVAVLPGCHWKDEVTTHSQAISVPRLG